jgi:hypothetical protein
VGGPWSGAPDAPPPAQLRGYEEFLGAIKERVSVARQRAVAPRIRKLLRGYWEIGAEILRRQQQEGWGAKVIDRLAADLRIEFPGLKGCSPRSLMYMRAFATAWPEGAFVQGGLAQISWYHHLALLDKLDDPELLYALSRAPRPQRSATCGWCCTVRSGHVWRTCGPATWLGCCAHQSGRGRVARGVPCVH